jgi:hypothetical protein
MPCERKIDLAKLKMSLFTLCPKCGYPIHPNETQRKLHRNAVPEIRIWTDTLFFFVAKSCFEFGSPVYLRVTERFLFQPAAPIPIWR